LVAILAPPSLLPLPPPASIIAAVAAVGVKPDTAAVSVVLIVGASDDALKDALATSGKAYSVIVGSRSLTAAVVLKRKSPARDGISKRARSPLFVKGVRKLQSLWAARARTHAL
jgi:hypothetical protein